MKTREERKKYREGFHIGLNWPDAWDLHERPGGPIVTGIPGSIEWKRNMAENQAWRLGWEDGYREKKETGRRNG